MSMTKRPWMPLYVADYRNDTVHLSAAQHGAYLLLIMHYWTTGGLPHDEAALARIAAMSRQQWAKNRSTVMSFFSITLSHKRLDIEIAKTAAVSTKRRAAAMQMHSKSSANAPTLHTSHLTEERKKEESVLGGRKPTRPERDEKFEEFKRAYPRRKGANPWKPAKALFDRAILAGSNADQIIAAARSGVGYDREKVNTEYIPQAVKWLRDERWKDLLATPAINDRPAYLTPPPGCQSLEEIRAAYGVPNGQSGTEVRIDAGMGKDRPH
jgi:uncharacterized protein YdaU (DUF1376 family)